MRLLINTLSPEQTVDLKRYLCFKLQPVLLSCEVRAQPISADGFGHIDSVKMDLAITLLGRVREIENGFRCTKRNE